MHVRWTIGLLVCLTPGVAPGRIYAQAATGPLSLAGAASRPAPPPRPHRRLRAKYDPVGDSTRWSVVTHKGKYFLTIQRPRLSWSVAYAGRERGEQSPAEVVLEFRTQEPQVALDRRLRIASAAGDSLEVGSSGAFSDPGVLTWSHFMRFAVPCADLARLLESDGVALSVGGIRERLKPDHILALRSLLELAGAWHPR